MISQRTKNRRKMVASEQVDMLARDLDATVVLRDSGETVTSDMHAVVSPASTTVSVVGADGLLFFSLVSAPLLSSSSCPLSSNSVHACGHPRHTSRSVHA
jgi:hypothetical protein